MGSRGIITPRLPLVSVYLSPVASVTEMNSLTPSVVLLMAGLHGFGQMNVDGRVMPARRFRCIATLFSSTRMFPTLKLWLLSGRQGQEMHGLRFIILLGVLLGTLIRPH